MSINHFPTVAADLSAEEVERVYERYLDQNTARANRRRRAKAKLKLAAETTPPDEYEN